jgi:hypothetical protein
MIALADAAVNASLRNVCADALDTLTPREAKVLCKLRPSRSEKMHGFLKSEKRTA